MEWKRERGLGTHIGVQPPFPIPACASCIMKKNRVSRGTPRINGLFWLQAMCQRTDRGQRGTVRGHRQLPNFL